ncbi:hypothetical protein [Halovivax limisalsi]|uniref:hypothetical protein n=1 Tax=Halovivax limisalsi TaxID=1453760 RepID=UPI001FFC9027|nr:hypothetical protein [Halovivax limisalsi]
MTTSDRSTTALRFALLTVSFGLAVVKLDGNPTAVFFGAGVLLLVFFSTDLSRIEIAPWISIRFESEDADDPERRRERE